MANNSGVLEQAFNIGLIHGGNADRIELMKGLAVIFPLFQHRNPRQTGLLALKADHFEQFAGISLRNAPLVIMVLNIKRVLAYPTATLHVSLPLAIKLTRSP